MIVKSNFSSFLSSQSIRTNIPYNSLNNSSSIFSSKTFFIYSIYLQDVNEEIKSGKSLYLFKEKLNPVP